MGKEFMEKQKNILFFIADQLRADSLGCMGNTESTTPNYDALSEEGILFENAFCQSPICVPSRCSFNTGWYPHTNGHRTIHYFLEKEDPSMMKSLKKNGYHVYLMGKSHYFDRQDEAEMAATCDLEYIGCEMSTNAIHRIGQSVSKEEISANPYYYSFYFGEMSKEAAAKTQDDLVIERTLAMIQNHELKEPFCLYVSLNLPHPPYEVEEPWFSMIDRTSIKIQTQPIEHLKDKPSILYRIRENQNLTKLTEKDFQEIKATYYGMIAKLDHQLGRVLGALKEQGYYEDTHILAFADHGDFTGDYGLVEKTQNTFEDCLVHIPCIIRPAQGTPFQPRTSSSLVELNDLPQTVADLLHYELDYTQFGKSLTALFENEMELHEYVLSEGGRIQGEKQAMEGYTGKASIYWPRLEAQTRMPEHSKAFMVRSDQYKYVYRLFEKDEFYDLTADPWEEKNVVDDQRYRLEIAKMKDWLLKKLIETTDNVPMKTMLPGRTYGEE